MAVRSLLRLGAFLILLVPLSGAACNGESSFAIPSWDAGPPGTRHGVACRAWAKREANHEQACSDSIPIREQWNDVDQGLERLTLYCEVAGADPNVDFDESAVANCPSPSEGGAASPDCSNPGHLHLCLPPGKAPDGAPCLTSEACASGRCAPRYNGLDGEPPQFCGVCAPRRAVVPVCTANQTAVVQGDGGLGCMTLPAVGQPCGPPTFACRDRDTYCPMKETSGQKVCAPKAALGDPCSNGNDDPPCRGENLFCADVDGGQRCAALTPATYGAACTTSASGDEYACQGFGTCDYAGSGNCVPPAPDGAVCDDEQGLSCLWPAVCVNNHCLFPSLALCPK
jgi:hypothetical protein